MAKQRRRIYCKFCDFFCYEADDYVSHLEKHHDEMIPEDMTPWQFSYYLRTGKTHGNCVICKGKTSWNEKTHKYNRLCGKQKCTDAYKKIFQNRMIGKYGKTTLLNDPEQQKKMLANRKISGEYTWRDHVHKSTYTGSYEKSFLEFLDQILDFDPTDVMTPSPHTYWYEYEGKKHFYIPDMFIPSLELEIEIKDGGDNANKHPKIQAVDKVKEALKDEVMMKNQFNYIKIVNKENDKFLDFLDTAKEQVFNKVQKPIYMTEKEITLDDLNEIYTESLFTESEGTSKGINTVIFDLGSVLVKNTYKENIKNTKIPDEYIESLIYTYFSNVDKITDTMTVSEVVDIYKSKLKPELKEYAKEAVELFNTTVKPFDYTVELLKMLKKKGYKIYYLSNWSKSSFTLCKEKGIFDFLDLFDGGIISYEVNVTKPDKKIYELLIDKYKLNPEECLFYDDTEENVNAANKLKIHGKVFSSAERTQKEIFDLPSVNDKDNTIIE